jgi:hypothetical protein
VFLAPYVTSAIKANGRVAQVWKEHQWPNLESYWLLSMCFPLVDSIECIKGFHFTVSLCAILTLEREIARDPSLNYVSIGILH